MWIVAKYGTFVCVACSGFAQQYRVAILPFKHVGVYSDMAEVAGNLPEMLASNLGESKGIRVLERTQINKAIANFQIEQSDLFDPEETIKIGRWLGATHMVVGSVTAVSQKVRIDTRVVDLEQGEVTNTAKVEGSREEIFDLVNTLSKRILVSLTGESPKFKELPRVFLIRTFTIRPPIPGPPAGVFGALLHQNDDPSFVVGWEAGYMSDNHPAACGKRFWIGPMYFAHPVWVELKFGGTPIARFDAAFAPDGSQPETQTSVPGSGEWNYKISVQPIDVRFAFVPAVCPGNPQRFRIISQAVVRVNIERDE